MYRSVYNGCVNHIQILIRCTQLFIRMHIRLCAECKSHCVPTQVGKETLSIHIHIHTYTQLFIKYGFFFPLTWVPSLRDKCSDRYRALYLFTTYRAHLIKYRNFPSCVWVPTEKGDCSDTYRALFTQYRAYLIEYRAAFSNQYGCPQGEANVVTKERPFPQGSFHQIQGLFLIYVGAHVERHMQLQL